MILSIHFCRLALTKLKIHGNYCTDVSHAIDYERVANSERGDFTVIMCIIISEITNAFLFFTLMASEKKKRT